MTAYDIVDEIERFTSAKARVLRALQMSPDGLTNHYLRQPHIGGARAMGRVNELIHDDGYRIAVTRERGATWRVRLETGLLPAPAQPVLLPRRKRPRRRAVQERLF